MTGCSSYLLGFKNTVLVPLRVFSFKKSSVVPFVVPLRVEIMEDFFITGLSKASKGKRVQ